MRILVLNYEYPPLGGGAGNATCFLSKEWGKNGITADIVTTWFRGLDEISHEPDNITVYRVKSLRKKAEQSNPLEMLSYIYSAYRASIRLTAQFSYDLIISFFSIPCGLIARKLFRKCNIPYIVLLRGGDVPGFLPKEMGLMHTITMPFTKAVWKDAEKVIANSKWLQELASKTANTIKCTIDMVPNGVDTSFFNSSVNMKARPFVFLFTGRFVNQKNLMYLLCQFEIANTDRQAQLVLTGDGPDREKLAQKIQSSKLLTETVKLKPWSLKQELPAVYQSAHCFVNPSIDEGMPNAILEAMSCGLPVLASNIGGNNELVIHDKNGYLFNLNEHNSLSNYMIKMINNEQCNAMGSHSRHIAESKYSWAVSAVSIIKDHIHAV
jgi:glycosyltransferase involved in cell wall biosynthesis